MARRNVAIKDMTFADYFRTLTVLHLALTGGQILYGGMGLLVRHSRGFVNGPKHVRWPTASGGMDDTTFYVGFVIALAALAFAHFFFRKRVTAAREKQTLADVLTSYRQAVILRDAIGNAVGLFATVAYMMSGNIRFIAITGLVVLVFLVWWPTREKCLLLLGLEEDPRVADPNATIGAAG